MAARFGVAGTWCAHPASNPMASPASADLNSIVVMFFLPVETTSVDSPRQSNASPRQTWRAGPCRDPADRFDRPQTPGLAVVLVLCFVFGFLVFLVFFLC